MSLFHIDENLCLRCGICVEECPVHIIEEINGYPVPSHEASELCIRCGHCVAVCPKSALFHESLVPESCPPIADELKITTAQADQLLRSRRSIRNYKQDPVDRGILSDLIETAGYAPTGHNSRQVKWLVIYERAEVHRFAGMVIDWMRSMIKSQPQMAALWHWDRTVTHWDAGFDRVCRNAPHVVVAYADKQNPMAQSSCTISLSFLELAAQTRGLGACWAGYFDIAARYWPPMTEALAFPEGHQCFGAMMVGYPKFKYYRIPARSMPEISFR